MDRKMNCGKHKGKMFTEIVIEDPAYADELSKVPDGKKNVPKYVTAFLDWVTCTIDTWEWLIRYLDSRSLAEADYRRNSIDHAREDAQDSPSWDLMQVYNCIRAWIAVKANPISGNKFQG